MIINHNNMEKTSTSKSTIKSESENITEKNNDIEKYLKHISDNERQTYEIAKSHLESSFSIEKSIGFLTWKKSQESED